jgi:serine/threonine protein kinase
MLSCRACHASSGDDMRYCGTCGEPLHDEVPSRAKPRDSGILEAGTVLGSYKLLDVLGEGGMGRVYLAEHTRLGRRVALKMLRSKFSSNPESIRRFFGEARAVNKIAHENIVEVTDFVTKDDGTSYYIMELLNGKSLYDQIKAQPVMELGRSLDIAIQVANALGAVHDAGIVHRDLKPENIFLAQKGSRKDVVKLLDFGIAKLMEPDQQVSIQQTGVGMILGTPTYMSPEQAGGRAVDHRSDIYSLGIILYELATGRAPFSADTYAEILVQHITQEPQRPSTIEALPQQVPPPLEQLILHCLRKDPGDRPQQMDEVEERLRAVRSEVERGPMQGRTYVGSGPVTVPPRLTPSSRELPRAPSAPVVTDIVLPPANTTEHTEPRRRPVGLIVLLALLVLGGGAVAGFMFLRGDDQEKVVAAAPGPPPAAETPAAPPAPAPAGDGKIELTIDSSPGGAEVFRAGEAEPLGKTPLAIRLPKSDEPTEFTLRLAGFEPVRQEARLDDDAYLSVSFVSEVAKPAVTAAKAKPGRKRPAAKTNTPKADRRKTDRRLEKGAVIDAFE